MRLEDQMDTRVLHKPYLCTAVSWRPFHHSPKESGLSWPSPATVTSFLNHRSQTTSRSGLGCFYTPADMETPGQGQSQGILKACGWQRLAFRSLWLAEWAVSQHKHSISSNLSTECHPKSFSGMLSQLTQRSSDIGPSGSRTAAKS